MTSIRKTSYILLLCISIGSSLLTAESFEEKRINDTQNYLHLLLKGANYDAIRTEKLSDLSFTELTPVIFAYIKSENANNPYAFHQLLMRNSTQYLMHIELLKIYAPDYLTWLKNNSTDRAALFNTLAASEMRRDPAFLAIRLTPDESLQYIKNNQNNTFRTELLNLWSSRLRDNEENRPINKSLLNDLLNLQDTSEEFLVFKGYWPQAQKSISSNIRQLLKSDSKNDVIKGLRIQQHHLIDCKTNYDLILKWKNDTDIVNQALKNFGNDTKQDHSKALRKIWQNLPLNARERYWCIFAMSTHSSGNEDIALQAIEKDGYDSLDFSLSILMNKKEYLKKGIDIMLNKHKKGYAEIFLYADLAKLKGFEPQAFEILKTSNDLVTKMNALGYLGHSAGKTRVKLLDYLGDPSEIIRISAINAFVNTNGLTKTDQNTIAPMLIKTFQTDPDFQNRQQALYVIGQWNVPEAGVLFNQLLPTLQDKYKDNEYWLYRMRLMCYLGLARLGQVDAYEQLEKIHQNGSALQKRDILLAYIDLEQCPDFAFEDLHSDLAKLVATAVTLIREYGNPQQLEKLEKIQTNFFWQELPNTNMDDAHGSGLYHSSRTMFVQINNQTISVDYRINMPVDQAWLEMIKMDSNNDGRISDKEKENFLTLKAENILENLHLSNTQVTIKLKTKNTSLDSSISQTFTFEANAKGPFTLEDKNFLDQPGSFRLQSDDLTTAEPVNQNNMNHVEKIKIKIEKAEKP